MGSQRRSLVSLDSASLKTDVKLQVTPLELQFCDAVVGRAYRLPLTIHNLGRGTRKIRYKEPSKPQFKLMLTNLDKELAPGLRLTVVVEYHPDKDEDIIDQLIVSTGTQRLEIPLVGFIASCKLEIESGVDFGTLVSNSEVRSKEISIINRGKVPGMFDIEYQGQLPILFFPTCGVVKPESSVIIRVDFCAEQPNFVNEVTKVSLQGHPDILLNIQAHVVQQIIELINMNNGNKLECMRFGPVFFGTSKIEHALLYNNSPEPISWVAVIQNDCVGEELDASIQQRIDFALDNLTYLKKTNMTPIVSVCLKKELYYLTKRLLIVDDKKIVDPSHRHDFAVLMRFDSVASKDGVLRCDNYKNIKRDRVQTVELSLTGSGLPVLLQFDPDKILNFPPCSMGEHSEVVCVVENQSKFLPVTYNFPKTECFNIEPERGKIAEGCIQNVRCSFIPHEIGTVKTKQMIEIIGPVADENLQSSSMKPFYHICLNFSSVCEAVTEGTVMDVNTGILPLISNTSGHCVVSDLAEYKVHTPLAMLQSVKTHPHGHRLNEDGSSKDLPVTLPSDTAASIRPGERATPHRSFPFTVNNTPGGHILVMADVLPVKLELSSNIILLTQRGFLLKSCFWETVPLSNHQNLAAHFEWQLIKGIAFSIFPIKGVVEAYSSQQCVVMWHPGFCCPEEGAFVLHVRGGNTVTLKCVTEFDHTDILISETIILFDNSPQALTTQRETVLYNVGQSHAYFQVCKQTLPPTINIVPSQGMIPFGGVVVLHISCTPFVEENFEANAMVIVHDGSNLQLALSGSVAVADVEIKPNVFKFSRTYVGSTEMILFVVENKGKSRAIVKFNLKNFPEFSMDSKDKSGKFIKYAPQKYFLDLEENSSLECGLLFSPKKMRRHNFSFQVHINSFKSSEIYTEYLSQNTLMPKMIPLIPPCNVQATGKHKKYTVDVPICLNDRRSWYRTIRLIGEVKSPKILFDPPFIQFIPVPLDVTMGMEVRISPQNYFRSSTLRFQTPTVRLLYDGYGDEIDPLSVTFPKGRIITGSESGVNNEITCHISFRSSKPVSFFQNIHFIDDSGNWYSFPVAATAENCILTLYPYLAIYVNKNNIILKDDVDDDPTKTRSRCLLPARNSRLLPICTTDVFNKAEFTRRNLFVGMEVIYEDLDESEKPKTRDGGSSGKGKKNKSFFFPEEGTEAYDFFQKVVNAAETWFSLFGWPEGPHLLSIPKTIRRDLGKVQVSSSSKKAGTENDFSNCNKTVYDVLSHLHGNLPPGTQEMRPSPKNNTERVIRLHLRHTSLLGFLNAFGGSTAHILPEFLLDPEDYKTWLEISTPQTAPVSSREPKENPSFVVDMDKFDFWSKRAWTDVFLQIYKIEVLSRVLRRYSSAWPKMNINKTLKFNPSFMSSNIYSYAEKILLCWLNANYENTRRTLWGKSHTGPIPSERWVINFDRDLSDGLVFASQLATYCPFLIETHLVNMYTQPKHPEQYLHNCLIITNCFHEIGFEMNIQAIDIHDPNPVLMLMLCDYMYERLPAFLPEKVISFQCALHDIMLRQFTLKNPSSETRVCTATIVGRDAADFSLTEMGNVTVSPKSEIPITVKFYNRFLHPSEASLLFISKCKNGVGANILTFNLESQVLSLKASEVLTCITPCFQWKGITVQVKNPFPTGGNFSVILVESTTFVHLQSQLTDSGQRTQDGDKIRMSISGCDTSHDCSRIRNSLTTPTTSSFSREFYCSVKKLFIRGKESSSLVLYYLPFNIHTRYCAVILSNKQVRRALGSMPPSWLSTLVKYRQLQILEMHMIWVCKFLDKDLLLTNSQRIPLLEGIVLPPKGSINIPVLYIPQQMRSSKSVVVIQMMKENKEYWRIDNFHEINQEFKRILEIDTEEIRAVHWTYPIIGLPQAPLPKSLPHFISSVDSLYLKTAIGKKVSFSSLQIIVTHPQTQKISNATTECFHFINYPEKFKAFFLPGNDPEFFVKPAAGELPPCTSDGILITVGFKPRMYSKKYKAVLSIQTEETCQLYKFNGLPVTPPSLTNVKAKVNTVINKSYVNKPGCQRNFVRENARLFSTEGSSTTKADLLPKRKQK